MLARPEPAQVQPPTPHVVPGAQPRVTPENSQGYALSTADSIPPNQTTTKQTDKSPTHFKIGTRQNLPDEPAVVYSAVLRPFAGLLLLVSGHVPDYGSTDLRAQNPIVK